MLKYEYRFAFSVEGFHPYLSPEELAGEESAAQSSIDLFFNKPENNDVLKKVLSERAGISRDDICQYSWHAYTKRKGVSAPRLCGYVKLITARELTAQEIYETARAIRGQHSDGFGEGLEQQRTVLSDLSDGSYTHLSLGEPFFEKFGTCFPAVERTLIYPENSTYGNTHLWEIGEDRGV